MGEGGLKYLRMSKLSTSKLGGAGGGGFNLLDNVPNLGVFFLKASLRGLGWEQKIILSLSHND